MPELNFTSPYVHTRVDCNTFTMGIGQPFARVYLIPQSGTLDLASANSVRTIYLSSFPRFQSSLSLWPKLYIEHILVTPFYTLNGDYIPRLAYCAVLYIPGLKIN